jgi:PAS domain S-box-containing protein
VRAEEALRESEERFRSLVENATVGIYRTTPEGRILMANPTLVRMLGHENFEELAARNLEEEGFEPGCSRRKFCERMEQDGEVRDLEAAWTRLDGSVLFIRESARAIRGQDGKITHYDGIVEDITERNRAETRLKESEEKFRKVFMTGADVFYVATLNEGLLVEVNDAFQELFGYSREEVIGKTSSQLGLYADPLDRSRVVSELNAKGYVRNMELRARRKGGEIFPLLMSINILSLGGEPHILGVLRDITEQRRMEVALRASEAGWRALFAASPAGMVVLGSELRYVQINQTLAEMNGAPIEAHIGKTIGEIVPRLTPTLEPIVRFVLATGEMVSNVELSSEMAGQPGILRHWVASFFPIAGPTGSDASVGAILVEITDRKRAEEAIRENAETLARILEATSGGVWDWNIPSGKTVFSSTYSSMLGYTPDEFATACQSMKTLVHPDDFERLNQEAQDHCQRNKEFSIEFRMREKSGGWHWVHSRGILIERDKQGNPVRMVGTHQDIQVRKQAEEAARASEERFRRAIDAAEAGLWEWDILTDQTFYSPRWCEIVGYSFDDPELPHTYNSWASRIHPDDYDRVMSNLNNHLEKGTKFDVDYRHLHRSGEYRWQNSRGQKFLDERGKPVKMVGCISDITERRRTEQTLQASIKQLRSLAKHLQKVREEERKDLAREIHDKLGQVLTGLKMDLAWLRKNLPQADQQDRRFLIEKLDLLVSLTDQPIAEVHRLATQLRPPALDDLGLEAAIEWQVSDFQRRTGINCEFVSTLEGLEPDPDRSTAFFRILQESLSNVVRHTQATQIKVRLGKGDGAFLMEVEDNGGGITKSETHDSKSLGLIGMRERALAFGGEVTYSGQRGKGTTVKVLIPMESPERES